MKVLGKIILLSVVVSIAFLSSCRKKKTESPDLDNLTDGQSVVLDEESVDQTVNVNGGEITVVGDTKVTSDINLGQEEGGDVTLQDHVEVQKVNMHNGTLKLVGSPTIETDLNLNSGNVYIGNDLSSIEDTVTINKINTSDSIFVMGGVLVIESDLNQNAGFITVEDDAQLIIEGTFNKGGNVYGLRNIVVKQYYHNNSGEEHQEPWTPANK